MPKTFTHLSFEVRALMQYWLKWNLGLRALACNLRRAPSSVRRKFVHNNGRMPEASLTPALGHRPIGGGNRYGNFHQRGQRLVRKRRVICQRVSGNLVWYRMIESEHSFLSHEQVSGVLQRTPGAARIGHETIYSDLYAMPRGELRAQVQALLPKGYKSGRPRRTGRDFRSLIAWATSIEVSNRLMFSHWDGDLIRAARYQPKIGSLVERKALIIVPIQLDNATAHHRAQPSGLVLDSLDAAMRLLMTYDNVKEMVNYISHSSGIEVFFAHPYSQWERGMNENTNDILRRDLPNASSLSDSTPEQFVVIAFHHLAKPPKSFGCKSLAELFLPEGSYDSRAY